MAKKKYYNNGGSSNAFQAFPPDNNMAGLSADQSMFGFPASSKVIEYPMVDQFRQADGGPNMDSIVGTDNEIDMNVGNFNRVKSNQRF